MTDLLDRTRITPKIFAATQIHLLSREQNAELEEKTVESTVAFMRSEINALMEWLDWTSVWLRCRPACSIEVSTIEDVKDVD